MSMTSRVAIRRSPGKAPDLSYHAPILAALHECAR